MFILSSEMNTANLDCLFPSKRVGFWNQIWSSTILKFWRAFYIWLHWPFILFLLLMAVASQTWNFFLSKSVPRTKLTESRARKNKFLVRWFSVCLQWCCNGWTGNWRIQNSDFAMWVLGTIARRNGGILEKKMCVLTEWRWKPQEFFENYSCICGKLKIWILSDLNPAKVFYCANRRKISLFMKE